MASALVMFLPDPNDGLYAHRVAKVKHGVEDATSIYDLCMILTATLEPLSQTRVVLRGKWHYIGGHMTCALRIIFDPHVEICQSRR
jgi:hypothetical protein